MAPSGRCMAIVCVIMVIGVLKFPAAVLRLYGCGNSSGYTAGCKVL
jgi:hypothetical protein